MSGLLGSKIFDTPRELVNAQKLYERLLNVAGPALTQRLGDSAWISPGTLANSWVNTGGSNSVPGYRIRDGVLQLRGTISSGTTSSTVPIYTLPGAYTPDANEVFLVQAGNAVGFVRVDIRSDGGVYVNSHGNGGGANVCMDGINIPLGGTSNPSGRDMTVVPAAWPWASTPLPDGIVANAVAWYLKVFHPIDQTIAYLDQDDTGWVALSLSAGWVIYGGVWAPPQYRVRRGQVWLRGLIKSGTTGTVATLPVGARPSSKNVLWHTLARGGGAVGSTTEEGAVQFQVNATTGALVLNRFILGGTNTYASLNGISYNLDNRAL